MKRRELRSQIAAEEANLAEARRQLDDAKRQAKKWADRLDAAVNAAHGEESSMTEPSPERLAPWSTWSIEDHVNEAQNLFDPPRQATGPNSMFREAPKPEMARVHLEMARLKTDQRASNRLVEALGKVAHAITMAGPR